MIEFNLFHSFWKDFFIMTSKMEFAHKNWVANQFLSKSRTLNFWPLLHRKQIFMWAGHTQFEGEVQNSSSFLQVGQKYVTYNLMDKIWGLFQNFDQPSGHGSKTNEVIWVPYFHHFSFLVGPLLQRMFYQ